MSDKQKALDEALRKIEKQFGKGSIMKLGEEAQQRLETIPSGSLALDVALGIGDIRADASLKYTVQNLLVKRQLLYTQLLKRKN